MKNCVYRFLDTNENVIYIGKAKNLKNRLNNHKHLPESCYLEQSYIDYVCFDNEYEMDFAERYFIQKLTPKYNTKLSDKPISFTLTELDSLKFDIYEINQIIERKIAKTPQTIYLKKEDLDLIKAVSSIKNTTISKTISNIVKVAVDTTKASLPEKFDIDKQAIKYDKDNKVKKIKIN